MFRLTPKILDLGFAYLTSMPFWNLAEPVMEDLVERVHESCSAAVLNGAEIIYVLRVPTHKIITQNLSIGSRLPAFCTSMGRVLLAASDLSARTQRTITDKSALKEAIALVPATREALSRIERGLLDTQTFDPAASSDTFSIALSDVGEIDLAVGYFPDLRGNNFFRQRLFSHRFICQMRRDHPFANTPLTLERFCECGQAIVRTQGRSQEILENFLDKERVRRRAILETPHFMSLPFILSRTDLIATVPHTIGFAYVAEHASITLAEPPLALLRFDLRQHWHRKFHNDTRTTWLRGVVASLFNDELDE